MVFMVVSTSLTAADSECIETYTTSFAYLNILPSLIWTAVSFVLNYQPFEMIYTWRYLN